MTEKHFDSQRARLLDSEERLKMLRPHDLIKNMAGITKGMTCIDLGCGTGTFSFPMVLSVGDEGVVYAVDDSLEMIEHIRTKNPPHNLKLVQCNASQTGLDSQIADFCLLSFILHEVKQPDSLMTETFRLLKPEGKVLVVEWRMDFDSPRPPRSERITREHIERLFKQAGLSGFKYTEWSQSHYIATGSKKISD